MISDSSCSKQGTDTDMQFEAHAPQNKQKDGLTYGLAINGTVPADGHVMETIMWLNESEH